MSDEGDRPVRVFVGANEGEQLPLRVLEYSIKRHTDLPVEVRTVDNTMAPAPTDDRFLAYTSFSYGRFAIPKLAGYSGRAIYLDSDMVVFRDIAELWNTPFDGAKILTEAGNDVSRRKGRSTAVMLLDCAALTWDPATIIAGLGVDYSYEELMSIRPLLQEGELQERLPNGWNSLDEMTPETRLLHYTEIRTQPWVFPGHPHGDFWIDELRRMLDDGSMQPDFISEQIALGFVRPSLLPEIGRHPDGVKLADADAMLAFDRKAGYVKHARLFADMKARSEAKRRRERELDPEGFRRRQRARRWQNFLRNPIKYVIDAERRA